jgi:hypothetical protein
MRTSRKTLEILLAQINTVTGSPATPYTRTVDKFTANIGNYHLSGAYGGVCVHRMATDGGGVTTPIFHGHIPKREAEIAIRAFLAGIYAVKSA